MILHAGLVARRLAGRWRGALIEGTAGAGKSDLALRAMDAGWRLVADDRVIVFNSGGGLFGRAPVSLAGRLEARSVGILTMPHLPLAEISFVVRCAESRDELARLPAADTRTILAIALPRISLLALDASAPALLAAAIRWLGGGRQAEY
ncbi:MAG: HPr kinase/phosphorylase [Caulobacteraceae bacterium]